MAMWSDLSNEEKDTLTQRYYNGEKVEKLALEVEMRPNTLERRLRGWRDEKRKQFGIQLPAKKTLKQPVAVSSEPAQVKERPAPSNEELFGLLKQRAYSLDELANKYDRSKNTVRSWVDEMRQAGYVVSEEQETVSFTGSIKPQTQVALPKTLADQEGQVITFAAASDLHSGSAFSQPTNRKKFLDIAYNEYGVRHVFDPGDKTTGVGGYRGQEQDLIPALRGYSRKQYADVTKHQVWLADEYTPHYPGLTYYLMGGNHDYWHVVNSGIDAVSMLAKQRDDMVYLGYDVADVPLTDRVDIRLWHPSGGVPYAMSYRLQKALEQTAFEELTRAVNENENPRLRILLAGHMHIEVKFNRGPMLAAQVGCFEGQTNYLKRKGLFPQVGGAIFRVWLTDGGLIQRVEYTFIPFTEIADDWRNWPVPPINSTVVDDPDEIKVLFHATDRGEQFNDGRAA